MFTPLHVSALTLLLLLSGCSDSTQEAEANATAETKSDAARALIATTDYHINSTKGEQLTVQKSGKRFTLQNHDETLVLFDLFATWCPPCRASAPHLTELQKHFAGKIKILGVSIEENKPREYYSVFAEEYGADYTLVHEPDARKLARALAASIGVGRDFPIPLLIVFKNGEYYKDYAGIIPIEMLESDIKLALAN